MAKGRGGKHELEVDKSRSTIPKLGAPSSWNAGDMGTHPRGCGALHQVRVDGRTADVISGWSAYKAQSCFLWAQKLKASILSAALLNNYQATVAVEG